MSQDHPLADDGSLPGRSDEIVSEGGTVKNFEEGGPVANIDPRNAYSESDPKDHARRGKLALILVFLLCGLILTQYVSTCILGWNNPVETMERLESLFNTTLPVVSGLVGAAVTYYFTKTDKR